MGKMGEYAKNQRGESIKIGTCESMYYLRADQKSLVWAQSGNVDPVADRLSIRFRFPFPDEDSVEPGEFTDHGRSIAVSVDRDALPEVEHYSVQFKADAGYLVSLPCPEGPDAWKVTGGELEAKIHRNGFVGNLRFGQQKYLANGVLCLIAECGGCGAKWRLETLADAEPVVTCLIERAERAQADRNLYLERHPDSEVDALDSTAVFYTEVAARIVAGYRVHAAATR